MKLIFVTPPTGDDKRVIRLVEEAVEGGADAVQLRRPGVPARELFPLAKVLKTVTDGAAAALFVNDRADVAFAAGAAGVHLGRNSLPPSAVRAAFPPNFKIGVSCHDVAEALQAQEEGADYIFLGTIFPSPSKPGVLPLGVAELARACAEVKTPIYAIGGVNLNHVGQVLAAGAAGVAVISAIADARSPRDAARALADALASWRGEREPVMEIDDAKANGAPG